MLKGLFASRPVRAAGVMVLAYVQGGCAIFTELQNDFLVWKDSAGDPKTQAEAASTHLAVITAARWDSYVSVIQPVFELSAKEAFDQAIPTTASYQSRLVEAYKLGLMAALPVTGTTVTQTEAVDAEGVATETSTRETTTTPGTAPGVPSFLQPTTPGAANLPILSASLGDDPFLRYGVAADLFQEVNMLNRALTDAVVRDQVEPYLLRVKVAVLPYRRELPADAYSDLSFFLRTKDHPRAGVVTPPASPAQASTGNDPHAEGKVHLPIVVPLLVTDNLESATDAASAQFIAELSAALTATAYNASLSGQLQSLGDRLTSALANERNALRTVVRLGENAIRVRLGATLQSGPTGRKAYALLPRTHTISLLVLIPRPAMTTGQPPHLGIVARTSLKKVDRGESLALSRTDDFKERFEGIASDMRINKRIEHGGSRCLPSRDEKEPPLTPWQWVNRMRHEYVVYGDYDGYFLEARCMFSHGLLAKNEPRDARIDNNSSINMDDIYRDIEDLWHSLMGATGDYAVSAQSVHLPAVQPPELPDPRLTVLLQDDGKSSSVVRVPGGGSLTAGRVKAELYQETGKGYRLAARSVTIDGAGVRAEFPSLQQLGQAPKGKPASEWYIKLVHPVAETDRKDRDIDKDKLYCSTQQEASDGLAAHRLITDRKQLDWPARTCWQKYGPVLYLAAESRPETKGKLVSSVTARRIVTASGIGSVTVGLQLDPGVPARSAYVEVEGAEITAVSGGEIDDLGRLKVPASGRVMLSLRNAAAGGKLTLTTGLLKPDGSKEEPPHRSHVLEVIADDAVAAKDEAKPKS